MIRTRNQTNKKMRGKEEAGATVREQYTQYIIACLSLSLSDDYSSVSMSLYFDEK
jgi:hypothetical protein